MGKEFFENVIELPKNGVETAMDYGVTLSNNYGKLF
jgi:hypothetical protein